MDDICHEATITKGFDGIGYMAEDLSRTDFHDPSSMQYLYSKLKLYIHPAVSELYSGSELYYNSTNIINK